MSVNALRNAPLVKEREHVPDDRVVDPRVIPHRGSFIVGLRGRLLN